ncbi:MAG: hypothetical protein IKR85_00680 [Clostridia bacterium]|nr:hypothetical protein [Clostridia bacterium]
MRTFARISVALALGALLLAGLYMLTSRLTLTVSAERVSAGEKPEEFASLMQSARESGSGGAIGLSETDGCTFVTVNVQLKNRSPFDAEWITLSLSTLPDDALVVSSYTGPIDITASGSERLYVTYLTRRDDTSCGGRVEYYIYGRYHSTEF